jgi:hypothetical protein
MNYEGLQLKREFYSPQYKTEQQLHSRMPDQRYLLYWNPELITDAGGNAQVEFYTSDVEGTYHVVVEGLDGRGFSGSKKYSFDVKPAENP